LVVKLYRGFATKEDQMLSSAKSVIALGPKKSSSNPLLSRTTGKPTSFSFLSSQNPILNQTNRIVTVGLISSYGLGARLINTVPGDFRLNKLAADTDLSGTEEKVDYPVLNFYKAKDGGDGSALSLQYRSKAITINACSQKGMEKKFDWPNKVGMKVFVKDMAKMLNVLTGVDKGFEVQYKLTTEDELRIKCHLKKFGDTFNFQLTNTKGETTTTVALNLESPDVTLFVEFLRCSIRSALGF